MPWCADCDRFYNPNTLTADGTLPHLRPPGGRRRRRPAGEAPPFSDEPAPWHFKVLVGATAIYLGSGRSRASAGSPTTL